MGAVVAGVARPDVGVAVAPDLPADGRRAAAQLCRDRPDGPLLPAQVGNAYALLLGQVAVGDLAPARPIDSSRRGCGRASGRVPISGCTAGRTALRPGLVVPTRSLRPLTHSWPVLRLMPTSRLASLILTPSCISSRNCCFTSGDARLPFGRPPAVILLSFIAYPLARVLRRSLEPETVRAGCFSCSVSRGSRPRARPPAPERRCAPRRPPHPPCRHTSGPVDRPKRRSTRQPGRQGSRFQPCAPASPTR